MENDNCVPLTIATCVTLALCGSIVYSQRGCQVALVPEISSSRRDFFDHIVDFYGIEKNDVGVYMFYTTLFLGVLVIVLMILFLLEYMYFRCFGRLIFGRFSKEEGDVKVNICIEESSMRELSEALKYVSKETSLAVATIVNTPMRHQHDSSDVTMNTFDE